MHKFTRVTFKLLDVFMIFMMVFGAPMSALAAPSPTGATIISDLPDYNPGATVTLTGAGWAAGESVDITVNDDAGQTWSFNSDPDPVADGSGAFSYQFQLPNWFVANYSVTATGATSGTATTSFTDLSIGTYDQCSNDDGDGYAGGGDTGCRWINGNLQRNNSVYFEGDATVQRVWLTGFVPGTTHTVTLKYGTTKGGKHAYDFLTTWDWSEDWIDLADRCQGITGCTTAAETYKDIPQDPNVPDSFEPSAPGDRQFVMRGGTLNSATTPTIVSGSYSGDSETTIVVSFTVASSGSMCPTSGPDNGTCGVALWFGAHVSAQANWGLGMGAGSIDGSPYHVALDAVDGASVGQRDNQMQANVVSFFPNGTIIIIKDAQPDDAQDFSFNLSSSTISQNFSLDDDGDPTLPNTTSPNYSVPPGTYTAKELNIPSGWTLAGLTCTISGTSGSSYTTDLATGTANITLVSVANTTAGDTVTCTYVDSRDQGYLKITKSFDPKTSGFNGTFAVVYNCGAGDQTVNLGAGASTTVGPFSTGTQCTVSEPTLPSAPSGWTFGTPSISPAQPVTITAGTSSTPVEVTVTNSITQDQGYLKITKSFDPQSSGFSGTFDIVYNCGAGDVTVSLAAGGSTTLGPFNTGTSCAVSEPTLPTAPSGWTFGTPSVSGSPATIVKGDQTTAVEVTVTNSITRDQGYFKITKSFDPKTSGFSGKFDIVYNCGAGDVTVQLGAGETTNAIGPFNTGTSCTVSEPTLPSAPTGWTFGTPSVSGSPVTIIKGDQAAAQLVTVTNSITRDQGYLKITKSFDAKSSGFSGTFDIVYNCGAGDQTVNLSANTSTTVGPFDTGTSCTVSEPTLPTAPSGWTFGIPSVSGSPATIVKGDQAAAVEVTVTNSITRDQGYLKITKSFDPKTSGFTGKFDIVYNCGAGDVTIQLGADESITVGPFDTGTSCSVSESTLPTAPSGWTFGTPSVSGSPATIVKGDQAAAVVVTVTNSITRDLGLLEIKKTLSNPDGASVPASFTVNYDCGTGYTGSVNVAPSSPATVNDIPTGSTCTVTEVAPDPIPGYTWGTITYTPASVTINTKDQTFTITVGNSITRDRGSLQVNKTLNDGGSGFSGSFSIDYDCGGGLSGTLTVPPGGSSTVTDIPTGSSCTVTEPTLPTPPTGYSWGTPVITGSPATITTSGATVEVTVANSLTRDLGSLVLAKSLTGGPSGYTGPFTINYTCTDGTSGSKSVSAGSSETVSGIPTGTECTVSETLPTPPTGYSFGTPTFSPSDTVTIPAGNGSSVTVTTNNTLTRDLGRLVLAKSLDDGGSGFSGPFTIHWDCGTFGSGDEPINAGDTATITDIPTGTSCTVSEPTLPSVTGYSFGTPSFSPSATVTIPAGNGSSVTVTTNNTMTRDLGNLKIVKTVSNPDGATLPASFTVNYNCGVGYTGQVSIVYPTPGFATVSGIPTGNSCSVTEVAPTPIPNYTWGTITYSPASVTIDTKDQTFTITVGNSITRDRGSLTIVKKVINDNGGTATVSAFGLNTTAGSLTFDSGVANGTTTTYTSQKLTVVTGNYTLKESDVYGYTEGSWSCTGAAGTVVPTFNSGSVQVGKDEDVTCTITNNDQPGTIVVIKNAKPAEGSFAFTTTGTGYNGFTLTGATTGNGNVNSQTLNAGTYTVKEGTQLSWILTGIGGSTDINTPYNCVITGSGGSTGVGDLNTQTATISLKNGDTVTCTFENTGNGATRTQGFWATHPELAQIAWFGGTAFNHTFPGVAAVTGIGDRSLCTRAIEGPGIKDISKLMGGFWSDISKTSTGAKRSAIDQARMQLLQQLLAAELNASAFGSIPSGGSGMFAQWESALCGTNQNNITTAKQQAASFNSQGDNSTFTPGTSANSKYARSIADIPFWNIIKP